MSYNIFYNRVINNRYLFNYDKNYINNNTLGSIGHKVDNNNNDQYQKDRTRKIVSNKVDLSQGTYQRIRYIRSLA